jgi:glyoxylase-like metal-dependent hydrolase (beta-lactamase superfamily II)
MAKEIVPNVYWLKGKASNLYLCVDEDGVTLVDCDLPKQQDEVWQALADIGRKPTDVRRILLTHADMDHAGSAAAIQKKTGATVYASEATAVLLQKGNSPKHMPWMAQFLIDHFVSYTAVPETAIEVIHEGDVLPILGGLQVIASPGHTLDHVSFYSPSASVHFAGDALNTRGGKIQRTPERITADQEAANRSAVDLLELAPTTIACGHGVPSQQHTDQDLTLLVNTLHTS